MSDLSAPAIASSGLSRSFLFPRGRRADDKLYRVLRPLAAGLILVFAQVALAENQEHSGDSYHQGSAAVAPSRVSAGTNVLPGTAQLIDLLHKAVQEAERNPEHARFESELMVSHFRNTMAAETNAQKRVWMEPQLAMYLLEAGKTQEAIDLLESFRDRLARSGQVLEPRLETTLNTTRAIAFLRLGEQENCLSNHNPASCIMPIQKGGQHLFPRGSRAASDVLLAHLSRFPNDLRARWLLNIAAMTLGDYPDKVPPQWLIPPKTFESDYNLQSFPDVAPALGLDIDGLAGGCVVEDFDNDGNLDVMLSDWNIHNQLRFFHNNGDGTFSDRTVEAGLSGITGGLNMIQADYNNDGFPDVLVLRGGWNGLGGHHPMSLLKNNGNGTFEDVTIQSGLLAFHPTQTAAWFDFNGDGLLDLFVGCETSGTDTNACELFRNNGDGTFTECAREAGIAVTQFIKGVTAGDYNNDGRPDLYLSNLTGPNLLFRNEGPVEPKGSAKSKWKFTNVATSAHVTEPIHSFPCWFWDYDNDGQLDLLVFGYSTRNVAEVAADYLGLPHNGERARLYHNNGDGTFSDVTREAGLYKVILAMGCNFGDLDNDGWLDFYAGTGNPDYTTLIPNRMFRNANGKFFQDVTMAGGFGHLQKGHGVSFADFNNDGNQDVFIKIGGAYTGDHYRTAVYLNPGSSNHWVTLKVEGVTSNRSAIGARIKVIVENETSLRSIYRTVGTGGSFGASPLRQEIGLGQAKQIAAVEIFWPVTGQTQVLKGLLMDHFYKVREGDAAAVQWDLKSFSMDPSSLAHQGHHHHSAMLTPGAAESSTIR